MDNIIIIAGAVISILAVFNFVLILKYPPSAQPVIPTRGGDTSSQKDNTIGTIVKKIISWIIFSVIFAWLPFVFNILSRLNRGEPITSDVLFGHGELYLISATLCAVAVGEVLSIAVTRSISIFQAMSIYTMIALYIAIIALASFGYASSLVGEQVISAALGLFFFSAVLSSFSIIISEKMRT